MKENPTYQKAMSFAIRIVNVYKYLIEEKSERVMSKQLLRSGTSIGANFCESLSAESELDFIHKLAISQKEANETLFWLELLNKTDYLSDKQYESLESDCSELRKIITSIILTTKQKGKNHKRLCTHSYSVGIRKEFFEVLTIFQV